MTRKRVLYYDALRIFAAFFVILIHVTAEQYSTDHSALSWSSSAPEVATVYNGSLTAMGPGTTKIAVSFNGKSLASFNVTVE